MLEGMKRELAFHDNLKFIYKQADNSSKKQIEQVNELLNDGIDLLIISPNEAQPLTPIVEEVFNKGIPVIVIDRKVSSTLYTAYVGADNYEVGKLAGEYAVSLLNKKGLITEVLGLAGSSPAIERHQGFADAISKYPDIKIALKINGDWLKTKAFNEANEKIDDLKNTNLVFAQNDMMALATKEAIDKNGITSPIKIIGIDASPGKDAGIDFVSQKKITASVLYPTGGEEAIRIALKILNKEIYEKQNILNTLIVDSSNVRLMKLQTDKIISQQNDIERQQTEYNEQKRVYNNQKAFSNILFAALLLVIILAITALYSWKKNKKVTEKLLLQNLEISSQKNKLIEMSVVAESAHQAKLNFFTNISHEFKTPLTLILTPVDDLLETPNIKPNTRETLHLIQRNVLRLYKLVTQLMDFRKIEVNKMLLKASENDLVAFTKEIVNTYEVLARKQHISLQFFTTEKKIAVWFDPNMIDKVIFNLISNAFKFTKENGYIYVKVSSSNNYAEIAVEDNGVGMSPDAIVHAFEPFFQGEYENYKGTGLGLALSKEFMELHHGTIHVTSEKWKGTKFEIRFPLGSEHFNSYELEPEAAPTKAIEEDAKMYTTELLTTFENVDETKNSKEKKYCILIIEDNEDLRSYLKLKLGNEFDILETGNGNKAIELAFENMPDLILSDIVLPGKNGIELTQIFKSDIRTAHIPVILLTARSSDLQKIEGLKSQADAYLTKPFNITELKQTINNLIANRDKVKGHYSSETFSEEKSQATKKTDRKFISEFSLIVETHLSNEKLGVEDICKEMSISRIQLYRKVKKILNCSVNDYIVNTRLQKAKYFLQYEDFSISEIAYKTGFSSAAYFSTVFKTKFGVTPSAFKENKT